LEFKYDLEFVNFGYNWDQQFSFDEQGLVWMYLVFWVLFFLISLFNLRSIWVLVREKAFHPIVRLEMLTLWLETVSLLFNFIHYATYASNGIGINGLKQLGDMLDMGAQIVFMLLLLLIAKGWAISRTQIAGPKLLIAFLSLLLIGHITLLTWENVGRDRASTLFVYESVPGFLLLVLRLFIFGWFLWELIHTFKEETDESKRKFYLIFGIFYSGWFLLFGVVIITAIALPGWDRAKIVIGIYLCMNALGFWGLSIILLPSKLTQYFQVKPEPLLGIYDDL